jgi:osmotically inducible protein OsmC
MKRNATAHWTGDLKTGKGDISTESGVLSSVPYSFSKRFETEKGANPEELIAAAHASCFTMALSAELAKAGMVAESLRTTCSVTFEKVGEKPTVTASHLDLVAKIPGASSDAFLNAAHAAETGCPISRLLNTKITMDAKLEG